HLIRECIYESSSTVGLLWSPPLAIVIPIYRLPARNQNATMIFVQYAGKTGQHCPNVLLNGLNEQLYEAGQVIPFEYG
ncbi:hypothetical protein M8C21_017962, partial [Ambrosia artemisiifolia]